VVLARGEDVEADLLGLERNLDHRLNALVLGLGTTRRGVGRDIADREDPELHGVTCPLPDYGRPHTDASCRTA
jgi:hypothetical protein